MGHLAKPDLPGKWLLKWCVHICVHCATVHNENCEMDNATQHAKQHTTILAS